MSADLKSLYEQYFTPAEKRRIALSYLSLCDDGYEPPSFIAKIVLRWLERDDGTPDGTQPTVHEAENGGK